MTLVEQAKQLLDSNKAVLAPAVVTLIESMILAVDDSFDGVRQKVQAAIQSAVMKDNGGQYCYCYVRDMFPNMAVFRRDDGGELYQVEYAIDDKDVVTLGVPTRVELSYVPIEESMQECEIQGDIMEIVEAAGPGKSLIKLIAAGQGAMAYYPKDVLKRDAATAFPKGTQMFWNHQTAQEESSRPVGDLSHLAGVLTGNAYWDEKGKSGPGVYASAETFAPFSEAIGQMKDHIGVSIRGIGYAEDAVIEGKSTKRMTKFTGSKSVDFVTRAGAGGKIVEVFESLRAVAVPAATDSRANKEEKKVALVQIEESELTGLRAAATESGALKARLDTLEARQRETVMQGQAVSVIEAALKDSGLPSVVKARIVKENKANYPLAADGTLDVTALIVQVKESAKEEQEYITAIGGGIGTGTGKIQNGGIFKEAAAVDAIAVKEAEASLSKSLGRLIGKEVEVRS